MWGGVGIIQVGLMKCGKFTKELSTVPGALARMELSTHNYSKAFAFGNADGTMEIVKVNLAVAGKALSQRLNS